MPTCEAVKGIQGVWKQSTWPWDV